jgi:hypothetical protein
MCLQSLQNRLAMGKVAVKIAVAPIVAGVSPKELTSALCGVLNRTKAQLGKVSSIMTLVAVVVVVVAAVVVVVAAAAVVVVGSSSDRVLVVVVVVVVVMVVVALTVVQAERCARVSLRTHVRAPPDSSRKSMCKCP